MLSALAKYIFGGIMSDAPETTSMQYETREINDWLLVDMPDQDIDNEDMDSESDDDDDILTAVPLLMGEEVSMSPRQIVLSYEGDSSCDKSYAKIGKGFHDKSHSVSSKVQVRTGDKIQGNFVANVEAISLETDDISNDKVKHNLSEIQEIVKSKQSKSKISKPKKSKKNKINKKCSTKMQDKSVIAKKKYNDNVQEKPNKVLLNLKEENQHISTEVPEKSGIETECRLADRVEDDFHIATEDYSSHRNAGKVEDDFCIATEDNSSHRNASKVEEYSHVAITDNSSHKNAGKVEEDSHSAITDNSGHRNQRVCDNFLENCGSKVQENVTNKVSTNLDKTIQSNPIAVENSLSNISKRSYADVVKTKSEALDKDYNKKVSVDKTCKNEPESPEAFLHDKAQNVQLELKDNNTKPKGKKSRPKKFSKNKMQNEIDVESQNIPASYQDEFQENVIHKKDLLNKTAFISSQIQQNSHDIEGNINDKYISDRHTDKNNIRILDTSLATYENFEEDILENYTGKVQENFDDKKISKISQVPQNHEINQDNFTDKAVLVNVSENCESRLKDISNAQGTEDILARNLNYNNADFQNEAIEEDFSYDIYFGLSHSTEVEHKANLIDNCQIISREVNDNHQNKAQNSFEFQRNLDDRVLENIADLWDIYTKIQDNSDDEMNENFNEDLQEVSDREMNEHSDEQITDDEMNENSQDENEDISDDELYKRSCGRVFQNFFGENAKLYNRVFEYSPDEESEESDSEMFTNIQDRFVLPSIKRITERKPELLQSFKCDFLEELKPNASEIPNHHSSCIPFAEYELVEYFNFEPKYFYACQSLQYPSSYALAIAEYYSNHDQYIPKYSERCNAFVQRYKKRAIVENQTPPASNEPSLITNSADLLQKIINQKCSTLPTKTAVVLEHVKDLKPVQQAIQYEARKYMTRSQLNRQNRNYIYQSSSKTNRRKNLQRNHSGVNNNRKCY